MVHQHHDARIADLLAHVPKNQKEIVAATIRTIFANPDAEATRARLRAVVGILESRSPKVAELLEPRRQA